MSKVKHSILLIFSLSSCAKRIPIDECALMEPDGFWIGLWHGIISPISLLFSLFTDSIAMYSANNTGAWYDLGFLIGFIFFVSAVYLKSSDVF